MIDNRTQRLGLLLPDADNYLEDDVIRLSESLTILDGKVATVDGNGKIPVDQIPAVAITDTFTVNTQAAMLALNAQPGDVAIRSDISKTFILMEAPATSLSNWKELVNDALVQLGQPDGYLKVGGLDKQYGNIQNTREQWRRQLADAGLNLVAASFEEGATVQNATDAVWHIAGGQCYTWGGALPKTVPAGSTPDGSGGISEVAWIGVGSKSALAVLAQPTGPKKLGWGETDLSYFIGQSANLHEFMSFAEIADANSAAPTLDHSQAFIDAAATGKPIYVPAVKGYYNAGDISLPNNTTIWGHGAKTYTNTTDAGMVGRGSSIRLKDGATSIFKLRLYFNIIGLNFWGVDKTRDLIARRDSGQDIQRGRFVGCGIHGFRVGVGTNSNYCKEIEVNDCNIANNLDGVKNLIDSKINGGYINANTGRGVALLTGANDVIINGAKIEWNDAQNVYCYQAKNIVLANCILDRSGLAGVHCQESEVDASTSKVRRSGRLAAGTNQCTHFYEEGANSRLIINGADTASGANDDGTGDITPERSIITAGSSTDMTLIVSGSYLLGATQSDPVRFVTTPAKTKITGCIGANDFSNYGLSKSSNGKRFISNGTVDVTGIAAGAISLANGQVGTYSRSMRRIEIVGRNVNLDGTNVSCILDILITRDGGNASILITNVQSYPAGRFGTAGTEVYVVSITSVAADASTFNVNISVTSGTATIRFDAFLVN